MKAALLGVMFGLWLGATDAVAQAIAVPAHLSRDDPGLPSVMAHLAGDLLRTKAPLAPEDRFRLELAAKQYPEAMASLADIRKGRPLNEPELLLNLRWEIYARAKAQGARTGEAFGTAFQDAAAHVLRGLDGLTAYKVIYSLGTPLRILDGGLDQALKAQAGRTELDEPAAVVLVRTWLTYDAYHAFQSDLTSVTDADDHRRYEVTLDIPVRTPDGAVVCAYVMRPRTTERLPALLNFTIYADRALNLDDARITAAHGYAAIEGFTRGKVCSPQAPVPMEHDGADADALIDWVAAQPWSNGKVGMYGGSYEGFTQWAAAKHPPKALKALMPAVSFSPGTDFPMEGNVFATYAYPWPLYTTDNKTLDDETYDDSERWARLQRTWYSSGRAYRDLDKIDGIHNRFFDEWLRHPSFDAYWQGFVPSYQELSDLDIPVLTTTGYYDSGQIGALSYLRRREQLNPKAEQYLVIGPYEHHTGQLGTISPLGSPRPMLRGYVLDPIAQLDIVALRYAWFDYILRGASKPPILVDRVNYEVMGANTWKHARSIADLGGRSERFYLGGGSGLTHSLNPTLGAGAISQTVNLADRSDIDRFAPDGPLIDNSGDDWPIVTRAVDLPNSLVFVSPPFERAKELSGLFSARLDFVTNKKDFDIAITMFELTSQGEYIQLSYLWQRASYAKDRSRRQLLKPGELNELDLKAGRLTSRMFQPGSRLVVALNVIKQPAEQINYGTGKDVSDETIADAGEPLKIDWSAGSYLDVPFSEADPPVR